MSINPTDFSKELLDDLLGIEAYRGYSVKCGDSLLSLGLARWQQTGTIGWFLTTKGVETLAHYFSEFSNDPPPETHDRYGGRTGAGLHGAYKG